MNKNKLVPIAIGFTILAACGQGELMVHSVDGEDCVNCGGEIATPDFRARPDGTTVIQEPTEPTEPEISDLAIYHYTELDTVVTEEPVVAGTVVHVTCLGLDVNGIWRVVQVFEPDILAWPEQSFSQTPAPGTVIPIIAGTGLVACAIPALSLIDPTPAELTIWPGEPYATIATASRPSLPAGESIDVECEVFDEWMNPIYDAEPVVMTDPSGGGILVTDYNIWFERTGIFLITCDLPGVVKAYADSVEVTPGLPASLSVTLVPRQEVYGIGQVITLSTFVADRFGNEIPAAPILIESDPPGEFFGEGRLTYDEDGTYTVTVTVEPPTDSGIELTHEEIIIVNGNGPAIRCDDPIDGGYITAAPGTEIELFGTVDDANGIASVMVNGVPADTVSDGTFNQGITVEYGVNFVDIVAVDTYGEENSATCAFIVAEEWLAADAYLDDAVILRLTQEAIDDNNRSDGLDSINDILYAVVNSRGLVNTVDSSLRAANPLKPRSCDVEVCVIWCFCVFKSAVYYEDFRLGGPNSTSLQLVDGGLRATATLRDIGVKINADATISARGWIYLSSLGVDMSLNLNLTDGRPRASIRTVHSVSVGSINLEFGGIIGFIIDLIEGLFHGIIRNIVRDTISDFITSNFDDVLDGVFGSLDISTLGATFDVPKLDGSGAIPIDFGMGFSSIWVRTTHAQFGISTRFSAPFTRAGTIPGVPLLPGSSSYDRSSASAITAAVYAGLINQVFYALWRAGFFDATLGGADLGEGVPPETAAMLRAALPPVVRPIEGNRLEVSVGALGLSVVYPGIFDEPLPVGVGARLEVGYSLDDDTLIFSGLEITEMAFSTPSATLSAATRDTLEGFLSDLIEGFINDALSSALPALPIPAFELPASLGEFGLPPGREMGLVDPSLQTIGNHFVLESNFGLR